MQIARLSSTSPGALRDMRYTRLVSDRGVGVVPGRGLFRIMLGWLWLLVAAPLAAAPVALPTADDLLPQGTLYHAEASEEPTLANRASFAQGLVPAKRINPRGGRYWLHLQLQLQGGADASEWTLAEFGSYIEHIDVFVLGQGERQQVRTGQFTADGYALHDGADIRLQAGRTYDIWLRLDSRYFTGTPTVHAFLRTDYQRIVLRENLLIVGCLGAIIALALYNFLLFFWTRLPDYFYYALYLLCTWIGWAAVFKVFVQTANLTHPALLMTPFYLMMVTNTLFYRHFLSLDTRHRRLTGYANVIAAMAAIGAFLPFLLPLDINYLLINLLTACWLVGGLISGLVCSRQGFLPSRFFLAGFACLAVGGAAVVLPYLGLPRLTHKEYLLTLVTQTLDVLFLALALADRINTLRAEREQALEYASVVDKSATASLMEANQKLHQALAMAEANQRQKNHFLMAIGHELRTPLNAISGALSQLDDAAPLDERHSLHGLIRYGAEQLSAQVENLIVLAETDDCQLQPQRRLFYVAWLAQDLRRLLADQLAHKPVAWQLDVTGPAISAYWGDDHLLRRLLAPVLENACKFTDAGQVRVRLALGPEAVTVEVQDSGPGIPAELRQQIFESFTQASMGYRRRHGGLGIGLTVCQRLTRVLGASITLDSTPGQGSRFTLRVPLEAAAAEALSNDLRLCGQALLVEDNPVNAMVLGGVLRKLGLGVVTAEDGAVALTKVSQQDFDVVLMDLQMPVMDGFSAAEAMRQQGIRCPIIAVTANSDSDARQRSLQAGMNDLLSKPLNREQLRERLGYWLQRPGAPALA